MRNVTEIQQRLIALKYLPKIDAATGKPNDDGTFGRVSLDAYNRWRSAQPIPLPPVTRPDMLTLNADLFPEEQPPAPAPNPNIFSQIGAVLSIIKLVKGIQMDSTTVDVKSAWLSSKNWVAGIAILTNIAAFFHIAIPPDLAPQVQTLVTSAAAIYIIVKNTWFTGSITTASAKKL